ncbi:gamma-glutamylcyclotransferase [Motiliproteus coralliicola]|uniref:glutathione-specific gamma-glutamylcyclotransferase n=1 Tax=Motiliproteus coralliicola TaxID=2283196 RepID=A0A369WG87_9GAMM|nr:gamma-glutamylcyclotransferase [Motiliproteus coralliicola]RDE19694.1 gamma-glutamylcyclotransferase [Motiliproteus coralliicola]
MHADTRLQVHPDAICPELPEGDLWVFAYGSLLWRPGFDFTDRLPARLYGYHRSLCVWSHTHRGTVENPGMVLGLDRGGSCRGCAYRVDPQQKQEIADYLFAREMPTPLYHARFHPLQLESPYQGQSTVMGLTFVVDRDSPQYAGRQSPTECARHVRDAVGISGSSRDYLLNTIEHLDQLGLHDPHLSEIADKL